MEPQFEKFSERARRVLSLAQEEAQRFNHNYIGTEHILLGLVRETEGVAARVLSSLGVDLTKVRSAVEFIIEKPAQGEIGLTPRAKKVVELAVDEARRMSHTYIDTEHLLIGLLREEEGVAAGVLESLGVTLNKARVETLRILTREPALAEGRGPARGEAPHILPPEDLPDDWRVVLMAIDIALRQCDEVILHAGRELEDAIKERNRLWDEKDALVQKLVRKLESDGQT